MATLKEFKEWLNRFPEDTIIEVLMQLPPLPHESYGEIEFTDLKLENSDSGMGWEFVDFTNNQFTKSTAPHYNKKYLLLGEK